MSTTRKLTVAFALGRIGFGIGLIAAPERVAGPWIGDAASHGGGQVAVRALGVRDIALSAGVLGALDNRPVLRRFLAACAASDLSDIAATAAGRADLPERALPGTVALAGITALAGIALAVAAES